MKSWSCLAFLLFLACEREEVLPATEGTLKTLLDNRERTSVNASATINDSSGSEQLDITAGLLHNGDTTTLVITAYVSNSDKEISQGEFVFVSKVDRGPNEGVCFYFLNDGNPPFGTLYVNQSDVGKVTLTEIDRTALFVSGTFEATVGRNNEVKRFTKGSFTRIPLTIN